MFKKMSMLVSVGLSILGLVLLFIGLGDDLMVKVVSEMILVGVFYECYFNLVDYFLKIDLVCYDCKVVKVVEKEYVVLLFELVFML